MQRLGHGIIFQSTSGSVVLGMSHNSSLLLRVPGCRFKSLLCIQSPHRSVNQFISLFLSHSVLPTAHGNLMPPLGLPRRYVYIYKYPSPKCLDFFCRTKSRIIIITFGFLLCSISSNYGNLKELSTSLHATFSSPAGTEGRPSE